MVQLATLARRHQPVMNLPGTGDVPSRTPGPPEPGAKRTISWWRPVEVLVLGSFAFAQPLFSLFGSNGTFLLAHDLEGPFLIWFALALIAVPCAIFLVIDLTGAMVSDRVGQVVHATILGVLLGLALGPPLNRAMGWDGLLSVLTLLGITAIGVALFLLVGVAQKVVRYAWIAPPLFLVAFLFASPASILLDMSDPRAYAAGTTSEVPVVWLVFDQFPLALMVDSEGRIVEDRFPGFARLAESSTWYPNATTVAADTSVAMPAALSGTYPELNALPVVLEFPVNVFSLLAGSHDVIAHENVTQLCPRSVCNDQARDIASNLSSDTITVLVRSLLADEVADRVVPEMNDRWAGFGNTDLDATGPDGAPRVSGDDRFRFEMFLDSIGSGHDAALYYLHLEKPHEPLLFLPDGRMYDFCSCYHTTPDGRWPENPEMLDQRMQAYLMQAMHADRELNRMLDRLEETSVFDDAAVVVMSDHGASLLPGSYNRRLTEATYPDILPVPLFIKLPGQRNGIIDRRHAQLIDILPTVLEVVDVDPTEYALDGTSLLESPPVDDAVTVVTETGVRRLDHPPTVTESPMIDQIQTLFPDPADPFKFGSNSALVGMSAEELVVGASQLRASVATAGRLADVDLAAGYVPAHVIGELVGADSPTDVAVSFNGTIAGVGSTFRNELWRISIMGDPRYLREGLNELGLYEIDGSGLRLIEID